MFGRKKQKTDIKKKPKIELSPKVAVADKLRLAAHRAGKKETQLRKTAHAELKAAKTDTQKNAVRAKYRDKLKQLRLEADIAYNTYENYIKDNFDSGVVDKVKFPKGNNDYIIFITQKKFINGLQQATAPKTTKKSSNAPSTKINMSKERIQLNSKRNKKQ